MTVLAAASNFVLSKKGISLLLPPVHVVLAAVLVIFFEAFQLFFTFIDYTGFRLSFLQYSFSLIEALTVAVFISGLHQQFDILWPKPAKLVGTAFVGFLRARFLIACYLAIICGSLAVSLLFRQGPPLTQVFAILSLLCLADASAITLSYFRHGTPR